MPPSLDTLPTEIIINILSYSEPFNGILRPLHPLYAIAATNRLLRAVVEEYTRGLLKRVALIEPPKNPKTRAFVCRKKWIRWLNETCQLCRKSSVRKAILTPEMTCCQKCDKLHFPKMTMTTVLNTYNLSKLDLFTPNILHPTLPPLNLNTYMCMGGDTLMISAPSVEHRKAHIYALLGDKAKDEKYLRRRAAAHQKTILHMDVQFVVRGGVGKWRKVHMVTELDKAKGEIAGPKSLRSPEAREEYVKKALKKEREALGMDGEDLSSYRDELRGCWVR